MRFASPRIADFDNVTALNRRFLELAAGRPCLPTVNEGLHAAMGTLSAEECRRISRLPFLLFTLGGYDVDLWRPPDNHRQRDLLREAASMPFCEWQLVASTLSLLWVLVRENRFSARLVAGAAEDWYALVGSKPIVELLELAAGFEHLVVPRLADEPAFWRRLIAGCRLPAGRARRASRLAALQRVLTGADSDCSVPLAAAACRRADGPRRRMGPPRQS